MTAQPEGPKVGRSGAAAPYEWQIQRLIERRLPSMLGLQLIASEFRGVSSGRRRADSVALDAEGRAVIIEYKRLCSESIINQALDYREWLRRDPRAINDRVWECRPGLQVDWSQARIICIAHSFARTDEALCAHLPFVERYLYSLNEEHLLLANVRRPDDWQRSPLSQSEQRWIQQVRPGQSGQANSQPDAIKAEQAGREALNALGRALRHANTHTTTQQHGWHHLTAALRAAPAPSAQQTRDLSAIDRPEQDQAEWQLGPNNRAAPQVNQTPRIHLIQETTMTQATTSATSEILPLEELGPISPACAEDFARLNAPTPERSALNAALERRFAAARLSPGAGRKSGQPSWYDQHQDVVSLLERCPDAQLWRLLTLHHALARGSTSVQVHKMYLGYHNHDGQWATLRIDGPHKAALRLYADPTPWLHLGVADMSVARTEERGSGRARLMVESPEDLGLALQLCALTQRHNHRRWDQETPRARAASDRTQAG